MKETKEEKFYVCKRLRLLQYLIDNGFEPTHTIPDANNWRYKNWIFERNSKFDSAIDLYFKQMQG